MNFAFQESVANHVTDAPIPPNSYNHYHIRSLHEIHDVELCTINIQNKMEVMRVGSGYKRDEFHSAFYVH